MRDGVLAAMYWFSLKRAAEIGHRFVRLGGALPYLDDGLLFYKGKWGGRLDPQERRFGELQLLVNPAHRTCRKFLVAHSMLARGSNGDFIIFSARRPNEVIVPRSIRADIARWYRWLAQPDEATAIT